MTLRKDFKKLVRARMAETGESYTAAHAALSLSPDKKSPAVKTVGMSDATESSPSRGADVVVSSAMIEMANDISFTYFQFENALNESNVIQSHPLSRELFVAAESMRHQVEAGTLRHSEYSAEQQLIAEAVGQILAGPVGSTQVLFFTLLSKSSTWMASFTAAETIRPLRVGDRVASSVASALSVEKANSALLMIREFVPGGAFYGEMMAQLSRLEANQPLREILRKRAGLGSFFAGFDASVPRRGTVIVYGNILLMEPDEVERIPSQPIKAEIQRLEREHAVGNAKLYIARRSKNVMITTLVFRGSSNGRRVMQDNRGSILTGTFGEKDEIELDGTTPSGKTRFTSPSGEIYEAEW
jgi:hypothetical protein